MTSCPGLWGVGRRRQLGLPSNAAGSGQTAVEGAAVWPGGIQGICGSSGGAGMGSTGKGLLPWTHCFSARLTNAQLPSEMTNLKGAMRIISRTACNGGEIALTHGNSPISIRILALTARENLPVRSI